MDSFGWLQVCERRGHSYRGANSQTSTEAAGEGASEFRENQTNAHALPQQHRRERAQPAPAARVANGHPFVDAAGLGYETIVSTWENPDPLYGVFVRNDLLSIVRAHRSCCCEDSSATPVGEWRHEDCKDEQCRFHSVRRHPGDIRGPVCRH